MEHGDALVRLLDDFDASGWCRYLPWEGAVLWFLVCEATVCEIDGDLRTLISRFRRDAPLPGHPATMIDLDSPVRERRSRLERLRLHRIYARTGLAYPQTVRQVAQAALRLGLFQRTTSHESEAWRAPAALPLPTEVLAMSPRQRECEDSRRQHLLWTSYAERIVRTLGAGGQPQQVLTTLRRLALDIDAEVHSVRHALRHLSDTRFNGSPGRPLLWIRLVAPAGEPAAADPERIAADRPCLLRPRWPDLALRYGLDAGLLCRTEC